MRRTGNVPGRENGMSKGKKVENLNIQMRGLMRQEKSLERKLKATQMSNNR